MFSPSYLCLVFVGGGFGAVCRYMSTMLIGGIAGTIFPLGTFTVNIVGSFIMGFIMTLAIEAAALSEELRLLLVIGFLGGFTTFSSFSMETLLLLKGGSWFYAATNILSNVLIGLAATALGGLTSRLF
jgi:fluoride exporter